MSSFHIHIVNYLFINLKESVAYLAILSFLPVNFAINHIKRHKDEIRPSQDLTIAEQLNVDADKIATTCATTPLPPLSLSMSNGNISTFPHTQNNSRS